jgi:hypothetical protein
MGLDFHQTLYRQILRVKSVYWLHLVVFAATIERLKDNIVTSSYYIFYFTMFKLCTVGIINQVHK